MKLVLALAACWVLYALLCAGFDTMRSASLADVARQEAQVDEIINAFK